MSARDAVLRRIRAAVGGDRTPDRLTERPRGPRPGRADGDAVARFVEQARLSGATLSRAAGPAGVPRAVAAYLASGNLPTTLAASPDPDLNRYPWAERPLLELERRAARAADGVSLTPVFRGIAETGTLALVSSPERPVTLNFLPETHVAILEAGRIVGAYEDMWADLRAAGMRARTVNLVTGPSRSADIGQKLQLGAHGPRRLHIVLVDDDAE